jgi:hypothetical protein
MGREVLFGFQDLFVNRFQFFFKFPFLIHPIFLIYFAIFMAANELPRRKQRGINAIFIIVPRGGQLNLHPPPEGLSASGGLGIGDDAGLPRDDLSVGNLTRRLSGQHDLGQK